MTISQKYLAAYGLLIKYAVSKAYIDDGKVDDDEREEIVVKSVVSFHILRILNSVNFVIPKAKMYIRLNIVSELQQIHLTTLNNLSILLDDIGELLEKGEEQSFYVACGSIIYSEIKKHIEDDGQLDQEEKEFVIFWIMGVYHVLQLLEQNDFDIEVARNDDFFTQEEHSLFIEVLNDLNKQKNIIFNEN